MSWLSKEQVLQKWHKKWNGGQDAEFELEESAKLDSDTRQQSKQGQSLFYWYNWTQEPMNTSISCRAVLTWISIWLLCLRKLLLLSLARSKVCSWQGYKSISQKHISWHIQRWDDFQSPDIQDMLHAWETQAPREGLFFLIWLVRKCAKQSNSDQQML